MNNKHFINVNTFNGYCKTVTFSYLNIVSVNMRGISSIDKLSI